MVISPPSGIASVAFLNKLVKICFKLLALLLIKGMDGSHFILAIIPDFTNKDSLKIDKS